MIPRINVPRAGIVEMTTSLGLDIAKVVDEAVIQVYTGAPISTISITACCLKNWTIPRQVRASIKCLVLGPRLGWRTVSNSSDG